MDFLASIGYFVGWFTLALINAAVAHSKKRSWSNWFLVSLFVSPAQSKQHSGLSWFLVSLISGPIAALFVVAWPPGTADS